MSVLLISGPPNSRKTKTILERWGKEIDEGRALGVVPHERIASELKTTRTLFGHGFVSLQHFVHLLARPHRAVVGMQYQTLLCRRLLREQKLRYFRPDRISWGVAREAAITITAFKRHLIRPQELRVMLETRGSLKEFDFLTLYERYESERDKRHLHDEGDLFFQAAENIKCGNVPLLHQLTTLCFDEFFMIEPGLHKLMVLLKKHLPHLRMVLTLPQSENDDTLYAASLKRSMEDIALLIDEHQKCTARTTMTSNVSVMKLRSPHDEARFIVHTILGAADDRHVETVVVDLKTPAVTSALQLMWDHDHQLLLPRPTGITHAPLFTTLLTELFLEKLPTEASLESFADLARKLLREDTSLTDIALENPGNRKECARASSIVASLDHFLHELSVSDRLLGVGKMPRNEFIELLADQARLAHPARAIASPPYPFTVTPFSTGRSQPIERIIIPGMTEGQIPSAGDNRLFFTNRDELAPLPNRVLDAIFPSTDEMLARDAFLFQTWLAKTRGEVILSFAATTSEGDEALPSSFLESFGPPISFDTPLFSPRAVMSPHFEKKLELLITIEHERLAGTTDHPSFHGQITDAKARAWIRRRFTEQPLSPSRLERYTECPFRFFIEEVLSLDPDEDITCEVQPKDRGKILHLIFERFYQQHASTSKNEVVDVITKLTDEVFTEHLRLMTASAPALHPFERKRIADIATNAILKEIDEAHTLPEPLTTHTCEWSFGMGGGAALTLPVEDEAPLLIRGRVDRIDVSPDQSHFLIVDYKTGKTVDSIRSHLVKGRHLQLPLYVEAVRRLSLPQAESLGGVLFAVVKNEKRQGFLKKKGNGRQFLLEKGSRSALSDEEWKTVLSTALQKAAACAAAIRAGDYSTCVGGCSHCPFPEACRKQS